MELVEQLPAALQPPDPPCAILKTLIEQIGTCNGTCNGTRTLQPYSHRASQYLEHKFRTQMGQVGTQIPPKYRQQKCCYSSLLIEYIARPPHSLSKRFSYFQDFAQTPLPNAEYIARPPHVHFKRLSFLTLQKIQPKTRMRII